MNTQAKQEPKVILLSEESTAMIKKCEAQKRIWFMANKILFLIQIILILSVGLLKDKLLIIIIGTLLIGCLIALKIDLLNRREKKIIEKETKNAKRSTEID